MVGRLDREERATYAVDQANDGVSTRSCLSFNLLKKKKQRQLPPRPEKGQTSSTSRRTSPIHPVTPPTPYSNDGQDYYSYQNNNSNGDSMQSLLVPPTPVDRSPRTLAAAASSNNTQKNNTSSSSSRPRRGLYQGELEPVGVRGQEAAVVQQPTDDGEALPHLRQFSSPSILAPVHEQAPLQFSPQTGQAVRFVPPTSNSAATTKPSSSFRTSTTTASNRNSSPCNPSNSSSWSISMQQQPRQPKRLLSDAESTASDDDIRYMMADWMPSMEADDGEPEPDNNTPVGTNHTSHRPQQQELEALNAAALENVRNAQYDQALQQFQAILASKPARTTIWARSTPSGRHSNPKTRLRSDSAGVWLWKPFKRRPGRQGTPSDRSIPMWPCL